MFRVLVGYGIVSFAVLHVVEPIMHAIHLPDAVLTYTVLAFASSGLAGGPGYPIVQVPAANVQGMPMGISFLGTAFSEPTLIRLASGFEAATHARFEPTFTGNATTAHTAGTNLTPPPPPRRDTGRRQHRM